MTANVQTAKLTSSAVTQRPETRARVRFRAPFALRCGALLIDYILLALIMVFSTMIARLMGGGARMAGGTEQKGGILIMLIVAVLDLVVMAGLTGRTVGKWTTGLRIERTDGRLPGIGRVVLRHVVGYPLSVLPFGVGFLVLAVSPAGRALPDLIADVIVVGSSGGPRVAMV